MSTRNLFVFRGLRAKLMEMKENPLPPALEPRFLPPPGWRWHSFTRGGRTIRFGSAFPKDAVPKAVVVCLPGLSEFCEKYFETAHNLLAQDMAFWVLDWAGQGKSTRYLENPHKRHSAGFEEDADDLHALVTGYIKPSSVHTDKGRIPLAMLAHSMGAHIGLRYLMRYPGMFECAAMSAPMFGLKVFENTPSWLALAATSFYNRRKGEDYVEGESDWTPDSRANPGNDDFSSDPVRGAVHNAWCLADPALQVGRITYGWLHEAVKSCRALENRRALKSVSTPCLIATAGRETLVDNRKSRRIARILPHAKLLELPDSRHEILMECDEIRKIFFSAFHQLIKESIIDRPQSLKPF